MHERGVMGDGRCRCIELGQLVRLVDRAPRSGQFQSVCFQLDHISPPLLSWSGTVLSYIDPHHKGGTVLQRITASPLSQKHNATKRSMIALAAPVFPWPGYEIPCKALLRNTPIQVLLLRANYLCFAAENLPASWLLTRCSHEVAATASTTHRAHTTMAPTPWLAWLLRWLRARRDTIAQWNGSADPSPARACRCGNILTSTADVPGGNKMATSL